MEPVTFFVKGIPAKKGSVLPMMNRRTGRMFVKAMDKKLAAWDNIVALTAQFKFAGIEPTTEAVRLHADFILPRPASHFDKFGNVKSTAPLLPTYKSDLDKTLRGLLDPLSGRAYADDGQVVEISATKKFSNSQSGDDCGARIMLSNPTFIAEFKTRGECERSK